MKQCAFSKTVRTSRNMSYITPEMTSTFSPCTRTPSCPSARPTSISPTVHSSEMKPCHDPQQVSIGYVADIPPTAGYEPKDLAENDDLCVKPLLFHRANSCSAGFTNVFAGERSKCGPITSLSLCKKKLGVKFISSSVEYGKPVALFSSKRMSSQETFSDREELSSEHQQVLGNNEPLVRFSHPETSAKSLLEGHRDRMLAEAKSEILKQECKVDSLNDCIRELQRHALSHRLDLDSANCGDDESPREQE